MVVYRLFLAAGIVSFLAIVSWTLRPRDSNLLKEK